MLRVVRGQDRPIGEPSGDPPHDRPLAAIALSRASEHSKEAPRGRSHGLQGLLERIRGVRKVDHADDPVRTREELKPPLESRCNAQALGDFSQRHTADQRDARRGA